jgi:hypothetical protein
LLIDNNQEVSSRSARGLSRHPQKHDFCVAYLYGSTVTHAMYYGTQHYFLFTQYSIQSSRHSHSSIFALVPSYG